MFFDSFNGSAVKILSDEQIFSVSEISSLIKNTVEKNFSAIKIQGEVSGLKRHSSGHTYLSLKDNDSVINAMCWRGTKINFPLEDGMQIIVLGNVTTYAGRSQYQFVIKEASIAGEGALLKLLNERRKKFAEAGFFDKKNPIPKFPNVIGIVTSKTGAVIKDMEHRLKDRYPFCHVVVWPVNVQGKEAAEQISKAIRGFNFMTEKRPDVLIVARGGGSIEDLWPFNEEIVVKAVYDSKIPVISAIGHETDTTLTDYAADLRAPTPTAAIEFATPVLSDVISQISNFSERIANSLKRIAREHFNKVLALSKSLSSAKYYVLNITQKFDNNTERFLNSVKVFLQKESLKLQQQKISKLEHYFELKKQSYITKKISFDKIMFAYFEKYNENIKSLSGRLEQGSYKKILEKGFCFISDKSGKLVSSKGSFDSANKKELKINFSDGSSEII